MLRYLASEIAGSYRMAHASRLGSLQTSIMYYSSTAEQNKEPPHSGDASTSNSKSATDSPSTSAPDSTSEKDFAGSSLESVTTEEEWTEVVDEDSGQTYFWHQKSGATTELGVVKPKGWRSDYNSQNGKQSSSGSSGSSGSGESSSDSSEGSDNTYSERFDPRAESFLPDKTGTYAWMGAVTGIFLGWASQYL